MLQTPCTIVKNRGYDLYGAELTSSKKRELCGVIELSKGAVFSTVRTDSSASRGAAQENRAAAQLLLSAKTTAEIGDLILVHSYRLKIASKAPQFTAMGKLDHYLVECSID